MIIPPTRERRNLQILFTAANIANFKTQYGSFLHPDNI